MTSLYDFDSTGYNVLLTEREEKQIDIPKVTYSYDYLHRLKDFSLDDTEENA